ncbi:hypothetical protein [Nocardia sp. NPDC004860]|uniref:hypothetical protein n=1 Tax=Nocardia sp. NPDC004860 TaxID=3154557 RepID=UPI0033B8F0A8
MGSPNYSKALYIRIDALRAQLRPAMREIGALDREYSALDIAPDGMPDLPPELLAPKEVRRLLEEANSGLLRVLEILEDARDNAVLITDPNQSDEDRCRAPASP